MTVKINGEVRQDTPIADLVFDVRAVGVRGRT
jgi:2-keto-4-pentenoate hydratase/2-oxohepta-3-ene-1,7-dioic acid hydratase in catechol pathway